MYHWADSSWIRAPQKEKLSSSQAWHDTCYIIIKTPYILYRGLIYYLFIPAIISRSNNIIIDYNCCYNYIAT
jgi:hypothetical protein